MSTNKWDELASKKGATAPEQTPQKPAAQARTPKTYRLSNDAVAALEAAVGHAMMRGERISREVAVERAILAQYGDLLPKD